jgi:putative FmdB family regulatory protein
MPTYEYLCNQCENSFEAVQSFTEAAIDKCPKCGGEVRKLYSNVGVVFKGSGFYKTDSRVKPAVKSESKPEVKTETKAKPKSKES